MGDQRVGRGQDPAAMRAFTKAVLRDLQVLEQMLEHNLLETGLNRVGAEQELFFADAGWQPAPVALEVLDLLADPHFDTEIGLFNLEINVPPLPTGPRCLSQIENTLRELLQRAAGAAERCGARVIQTGILPTLKHANLTLDYLTPRERYYALNETTLALRGGPFRLRIEGTDELQIEHDSVMIEACNTSFQVHLQVGAAEFPRLYNAAQAALGPVLAAAVNSPLLFGKRLWEETRIAVFQQSLDTRHPVAHVRDLVPRVRFGDAWVQHSAMEIFHHDISRQRVMFFGEITEDPRAVLKAGGVPQLQAFRVHNSSVYRWNRPCYGVWEGKPHLRIECRALPAGPTLRDEVANAALWLGLVVGLAEEHGDVARLMDFDDARANFIAAARYGLRAGFSWLEGKRYSARDLLLLRLLPTARQGLRSLGVAPAEADGYLGVIEQRVATGRTGARWLLDSYNRIRSRGTRAEQLATLTAVMASRARSEDPVHEWEPVSPEEMVSCQESYVLVEQCMTTDLYTVHADDPLELAATLMDRHHVRQVLVEDDDHRLVGLVSYRLLLRQLARGKLAGPIDEISVSDIMERDLPFVPPDMPTLQAIRLMRETKVSALPVLKNEQLVGIISERDFLPVTAHLLEARRRG
jgi:CBS domain-containing protein/gamma-glutamyl:cysteine ligase YbdK (ATP-grasp superfamily)